MLWVADGSAVLLENAIAVVSGSRLLMVKVAQRVSFSIGNCSETRDFTEGVGFQKESHQKVEISD